MYQQMCNTSRRACCVTFLLYLHRQAQFLQPLMDLQVVFAEPCTGADDEVAAYEELKRVIRSCLSLDPQHRATAHQVQKNLFGIMHQRGRRHDTDDAPSLPENDSEADEEDAGEVVGGISA